MTTSMMLLPVLIDMMVPPLPVVHFRKPTRQLLLELFKSLRILIQLPSNKTTIAETTSLAATGTSTVS